MSALSRLPRSFGSNRPASQSHKRGPVNARRLSRALLVLVRLGDDTRGVGPRAARAGTTANAAAGANTGASVGAYARRAAAPPRLPSPQRRRALPSSPSRNPSPSTSRGRRCPATSPARSSSTTWRCPTEKTGARDRARRRHRRAVAQARDGLQRARLGERQGLRRVPRLRGRHGVLRPARRRRAQLPRRPLHAGVRRVPAAPRSGEPPHQRQAAALRHGPHAAPARVERWASCRRRGSTTASRSTARTSSASTCRSTTRPTRSAVRAPAPTPLDFDFTLSRSGESYYVDNNSRPVLGGQLVASVDRRQRDAVTLGASVMRGTYDPEHELRVRDLIGAHAVAAHRRRVPARASTCARRTEMALGEDPAARFRTAPAPTAVRSVLRQGRLLRRARGAGRQRVDVGRCARTACAGAATSSRPATLRSDSACCATPRRSRSRCAQSLRLKLSCEFYDFSDFEDESVVHLGIAGPF